MTPLSWSLTHWICCLAALLAWRAAYYLLPLVAAVAFYAGVEARAGVSRG